MRRNGFGATARPSLARPGNGYGRPAKPRPYLPVVPAPEVTPEMFVAPVPRPEFSFLVGRNLEPRIVWDTEAKPTPPEPFVLDRPKIEEFFSEERENSDLADEAF